MALLALIVHDNDADMLRSVDDRIIAHCSTALNASDDTKVKTAHVKVLLGLLKSGPVIPDDVQLSIFHRSKRAAFSGYFDFVMTLMHAVNVEDTRGSETSDHILHDYTYCVNLARFANLCACSRNAVSLGIQAVAIQVFPLDSLLEIIGACQRRHRDKAEPTKIRQRSSTRSSDTLTFPQPMKGKKITNSARSKRRTRARKSTWPSRRGSAKAMSAWTTRSGKKRLA